MFKLINFSLKEHSILKNISVDFIPKEEIIQQNEPYSSVLIGPNGVGKSQILRCVAETLREFEKLKNTSEKWNRGFNFSLHYQLHNDRYLIRTTRFSVYNRDGVNRPIVTFKNPPENYQELDENELSKYEVKLEEVELPTKLLVSSIMLNDKFTYVDSKPTDFYQYLGIRRTSRSTTTQTFTRKTIRYLFDASKTDEFKIRLSDIVEFMGLEKSIKVSYSIKYKPVFEKRKPDEATFHQFFNEWWKVEGVRRSEDRKPWGKWYYDKIKEDSSKINALLNLLSAIVDSLQFKHGSKRSKEYIIDVFQDKQLFEDFSMIEELVYLDLLRLEGIKIKKRDTDSYSVENSSSGEYHLLISLLGIFSRIEQNSIILIDEPEISLHPNWQMRYVHELKNMFCKFPSCHFIIASHSHFLVSDLKNESSSVISVQKDIGNDPQAFLVQKDTYGWSAEDVLYKVFDVRTTRNYYLEIDMRELLYLISENHKEKSDFDKLLQRLEKVRLTDEDPLNLIIDKAKAYIESL
jgi:predicted ATP-binding protein involved in virulence